MADRNPRGAGVDVEAGMAEDGVQLGTLKTMSERRGAAAVLRETLSGEADVPTRKFEEYILKDAWRPLPSMMLERWYERPVATDRCTDGARWSGEAPARAATASEQPV